MSKKMPPTPMLDQLESGPWPSFVTGLKRLAEVEGKAHAGIMKSLLGQLEHSYQTRKGYWKGGTVGVFGYGAGVIPRFSEVADQYPESSEFHTLRIMPAPGFFYDTKTLREMCDIWEEHGSGLIALHGQSGDIMFQGCRTEQVQAAWDKINEMGFDMGGAGAGVRTSASCVGPARCEQACFDTLEAHRTIINDFVDDIHRPSLPYKLKFKFSGCANDCANATQRADVAILGTWKDDMQVDQTEVQAKVRQLGRKEFINQVIRMCPTQALGLNDDDTLDVDNKSCVRCMHCINVCTKALKPGKERGICILVGGKRTLKIGDLMGTVVMPFMKLETEEDYEKLLELAHNMLDFFADNALEHERTGEMIERIGLVNYLEALGLPLDVNMINQPRTNSYIRTDGWEEEARKWAERKNNAAE
ncbi:dissimilatory-type sulfite reductase subunit alpha [Magnetospirillum sp. 15-1]|uniref:dissimilatory-type sulfite reductase subunit alpha n=1 Tax=Magnetospirillum sp. 15-1 TaxID=1979370 RepID=UPI000BBC5C24|nr:dissimilatory-type sulfite reductase subunit alpha [Magnetospirillum sp. 15-1]